MKQLGMRLRALREGTGLSQSKFADVIGSTQSSINRHESGQCRAYSELLERQCVFVRALFCIKLWR